MSLKTLVFIPSGKTPCAFFIKRRCDLRLRFVLVEYNPRRLAQSGDQIRYKEYSGSSSERQSLAWNSAAGQESLAGSGFRTETSGPGMSASVWFIALGQLAPAPSRILRTTTLHAKRFGRKGYAADSLNRSSHRYFRLERRSLIPNGSKWIARASLELTFQSPP